MGQIKRRELRGASFVGNENDERAEIEIVRRLKIIFVFMRVWIFFVRRP